MTLSLRQWWNRMASSSPSGRHAGSPGRPPTRLHLEVLEGRCVPTTVTTLDNAGMGSLRQAIMDTPAGGTVDFQDGLTGTITLTSGELLIDKDLTIAGPGADVLTVSGNHASRVFDIAASFDVAISELSISDGRILDDSGGAGIFNAGRLNLSSSTVRSNVSAVYAGGIFNTGMLTITDSAVSGNTQGVEGYPSAYGGGIVNRGGTLTITSSTVSDNSANQSGGIQNESGGVMTLTDSTVSGNSATNNIGGIFSDSSLTIYDSTITGNTAGTGVGGGISNGGSMNITNSTVSANSAGTFGGGIENDGSMTAVTSTITGNRAGDEGGG
jgi:hypothetical protein